MPESSLQGVDKLMIGNFAYAHFIEIGVATANGIREHLKKSSGGISRQGAYVDGRANSSTTSEWLKESRILRREHWW